MLTLEQIKSAAATIATEYPIKNIMLFGSYAEGTHTAESDIDLLIEFYADAVSLLMLSDIKFRIEELLGKSADIIHAPIPDSSLIKPDKLILLYAA